MKEAKDKLKADGEWISYVSNPGNGKTVLIYQCNEHVGCGKLRRAVKVDGGFDLQETGTHTTQPKLYKRKNSVLTKAEAMTVQSHYDSGARPGGVLVALTKAKATELKKAQVDPLEVKIPKGGLPGEQGYTTSHISAHTYGYTLGYIRIHVSYARIHVSALYLVPGVPTLEALQKVKKAQKKQKTQGVAVECLLDLKHFCLPLLMPPSATQLMLVDSSPLANRGVLYIPQDAIYETEGAAFTGKMQVQWMKQLMDMPNQFVLHCDGKYKLHHGQWILITAGTHMLRWDQHNGTLCTTFVPLVYLMCKQHESIGACRMLLDAMDKVCTKYFGLQRGPEPHEIRCIPIVS